MSKAWALQWRYRQGRSDIRGQKRAGGHGTGRGGALWIIAKWMNEFERY